MTAQMLYELGWVGVRDFSLVMVVQMLNSGRLVQNVDEDDREVMQYEDDYGEWKTMAERKF